MSDPFLIEGPALISFSGGRTSGFMLRKILDRGLQPDVHVVYSNTGKEDNRTLDFVHAVDVGWHAHVRWIEYRRRHLPVYKSAEAAAVAARIRERFGLRFEAPLRAGEKEAGFVEVDYRTAARTTDTPSERHPFMNLLGCSGMPNPSMRLCTTELKVRIMKRFMLSLGYDHWVNVVGLRADEPERVRKLSVAPPERWENVMPLAAAGIVEKDVHAFWKSQPFDLALPIDPVLGTYEGNCDLCMLKGDPKKVRILRERPEVGAWWAAVEEAAGLPFRRNSPLKLLSPKSCLPDQGECFCHD
jgi:3'-phosphoadenosine 5'-phosphosulfate sulfotransferase (PAPS reductase)/FAD synthetase